MTLIKDCYPQYLKNSKKKRTPHVKAGERFEQFQPRKVYEQQMSTCKVISVVSVREVQADPTARFCDVLARMAADTESDRATS